MKSVITERIKALRRAAGASYLVGVAYNTNIVLFLSACSMPHDAEMAGPLLRRMVDGEVHQLENLAEAVAKNMGPICHKPSTPAKDGVASDPKHDIIQALESMAQAGLVSYPRRGTVKITMKGLEEIDGDLGHLESTDSNAQRKARVEGVAHPVDMDKSETTPLSSPPLSPEEIANIKAIASGAIKMRHVSKSELFRIVSDGTGPKAHLERPVQ